MHDFEDKTRRTMVMAISLGYARDVEDIDTLISNFNDILSIGKDLPKNYINKTSEYLAKIEVMAGILALKKFENNKEDALKLLDIMSTTVEEFKTYLSEEDKTND